MPTPFDLLVDIIHSATLDSWKERNEKALSELVIKRYGKRAEKSVSLRAPDMKGNEAGIPYAAYIHPQNTDSGGYGGTSFVIFPVEGEPSLVTLCIGTQGLAPDDMILGRPGHIRKIQAVCAWLNHSVGRGSQVAWAKQDPTRLDIDIPLALQNEWPEYDRAFKKYGKHLYAVYRPTKDHHATIDALTGMLDVMFQERGQSPLKEFQEGASAVESKWFSYLMPTTTADDVAELLKNRRYVIIQGPPGTGKTRMAREMLIHHYAANGQTIQFHPNTTYENFIGGLAPVQESTKDHSALGFSFAPKQGFLMEAAATASERPKQDYLLHIDEINRADLGKILGEAIYLLEPNPESPRNLDLPYDFGTPFFRTLSLPSNLHILGTMNSADRSEPAPWAETNS